MFTISCIWAMIVLSRYLYLYVDTVGLLFSNPTVLEMKRMLFEDDVLRSKRPYYLVLVWVLSALGFIFSSYAGIVFLAIALFTMIRNQAIFRKHTQWK